MLIEIRPHDEGCVIGVRAQPGAKRTGVTGIHNRMLKVAVTAPPDKGRANDALTLAIAEAFELKPSAVELIGGATSREKRFLLRGVSVGQVERCVQKLTE